MEPVIQTVNLTKYYGKNRGIKNVSIIVNKGDIYGFLGPNGAGKSTMIRTLLDFIRPSSGHASILGMDCQKDSMKIRKQISYIPGDVSLYGNMTGHMFLRYFGKMRGGYNAGVVNKYAERFDINLDRKIKEYSKGMRQKVVLIQAFMNDPEVIIMDEPTSGLDPLVQQTFMEAVREEASHGKTIFMSSHVLSEVEKICNRVAIIREGEIVAEESMASLRGRFGKVIEVKFKDDVIPTGFRITGTSNIEKKNGYYRMTSSGNIKDTLRELSAYDLEDVNMHSMNLEDVFMHYYSGGK
ncbi:MAG TPA: ABC transporter ATP-binding protein [Methanocella sp.]|nr:ABC transporter ATP-binding protein [Methanocella sp.]